MHYRIVVDLPLKIGDTFEFNEKFFEVCPHEEGLNFCDGCYFFEGGDKPCPPVCCTRLVFKEIKEED